jgi:predicted AAA+ superfamily ATPase
MALDDLFELSRRFLRTKHRDYARRFFSLFSEGSRLSVITGQRGVGKTTGLVQIMRARYTDALVTSKVLYLPCDHFAIGKRSIYAIAEEFALKGGELLCLDEIHKTPQWSSILKSIYETFPELTVIASGSSSLKLKAGTGDLARRALFYRLPGLSFREYLELRLGIALSPAPFDLVVQQHEELVLPVLEAVAAHGRRILALFNDYLRHGYYPYFLDLKQLESFWQSIEQDAHVTIESDLLFVHPELSGNTARKLHQLLAIISSSVPFTPDLRKLKQAVDIVDDRTLKSYLGYLQDGGLIRMLAKGKTGLGQMQKPEKIFLDNTNQQYALCPGRQANPGTLRETFFASALASSGNQPRSPRRGDFLVNETYTVEVGGKGKDFTQLSGLENACLFLDDIEQGVAGKAPLWLAGFLY